MARITGSIPNSEIRNLSPRELDDALVKLHRELIDKHGYGLLHTGRGTGGEITWTFDYAVSFDNEKGESPAVNPFVEPMSDKLLDAMHTARVKLCNMSAVKLEGDHYVPVDPEDENAANTCGAINEIERVLAKHGRGTKTDG